MQKATPIKSVKLVLTLLFSLSAMLVFPQDAKQRKQISDSYDKAKIEKLKSEFTLKAKTQKAAALAAAKINGWEVYRLNQDGTYDELMSLSDDGKPIYYSIENVNAAKSTRANTLNTGGILSLSLDGQGMYSGVWDGGAVRTTHQEFDGRAVVGDGNTVLSANSAHATHVTGTVSATGVSAGAKGMAPLSTVKTFDWSNDLPEVLEEAQNGLLLSNHSYGIPLANAPGNWYMGAYSAEAAEWDQVSYSTPYYLMVLSAGNDGNATNPAPMTSGYDKLTGNKNAKNNLVIANAQDATVDAQGNLVSVSINSSSSEGPSDDRRIKPDLTGNGTGLFSSTSASNTDYSTYSGTSMASPNVMGTLLLLQQHYKNVNNQFMKSATLKGLACNTADDKGRVGPDAVWGWGLLNAKKAAQAITTNGLQSWISEETLAQGQTYTFNTQSDGVNPMIATLCWTDVPGIAVNGTLNGTTPALVNDLDIRVTNGSGTFYPWRLQSVANLVALRTGDNNVDNVEGIKIDAPAGAYTVTVTHKGTLQNGPQNFSLIVTGITSSFSIASTSGDMTSCLDGNASYTFNYTATDATPVNFTASGLPNGAIAAFNTPTLSASGSFSMAVSNLQNAVPGIYPITISGNNGADTQNRTVILKISSTNFGNVTLDSPVNNQTAVATSLQLSWQPIGNADSFHLQVSTDSAFSNIIATSVTTSTSYSLSGLNEDTNYYWRVFPINFCGEATVSNQSTFKTGQLVCGYSFAPQDYVDAAISDLGESWAILQFPVSGGITIGDVNVVLNLNHTYIEDLTIFLQGPESLGFPRATLFNEPCGDYDNIDCTVDDSGSTFTCSATMPGISGIIKPYQSLNVFNNKLADGMWYLYVHDGYTGDGGIVNSARLDFCSVVPSLGVQGNSITNFSMYPNPTNGIINIKLTDNKEGKTTMTLFDIQGRSIVSKSASSLSETIDISHLQDGVYMLSVENGNQKTTKKIVLNK